MSLRRFIGSDFSEIKSKGPDALKSRFRREIYRRNESLHLDSVGELLPYAVSGILFGTMAYFHFRR